MRIIPGVVTLLLLAFPALSSAQSFALHGSAGPTMTDPGHSVAAGLEFSPTPHITVLVDVERTHLPSRIQTYERVTSAFRGEYLGDGDLAGPVAGCYVRARIY